MKITGINEVVIAKPNDGVSSNLNVLTSPIASSFLVILNALGSNFLITRVKYGPATNIAMMATIIPYIKTIPMLAPRILVTAVGDGCGGKNP